MEKLSVMETRCERVIELMMMEDIWVNTRQVFGADWWTKQPSASFAFLCKLNKKREVGTKAAFPGVCTFIWGFLLLQLASEVGVFSISPPGAVFHSRSSSAFRAENTYWHRN